MLVLNTTFKFFPFHTGPPGPPQYLEAFNTSYNYIRIKWEPPLEFFDGPMSGYIVKVTNFGDPGAVVRLVYSSCQTGGIDITDLEEKVAYCVYVTTFNEYGKSNSSSCLPVFTGEKGSFLWLILIDWLIDSLIDWLIYSPWLKLVQLRKKNDDSSRSFQRIKIKFPGDVFNIIGRP